MDASTHSLAEHVRANRVAIDNDLELLRVRLQKADPRRLDPSILTNRVLPVVAGAATIWLWNRQRRRVASLRQLLIHCLRDLHRAERVALPALHRMCARSYDDELKNAFLQHLHESEAQIERLERVFRSVGAKPPKGRCSHPVSAIAASGERLLSRKVNRHVRDAWLIATAQRIEHIEIAGYGTARTYADMLGYTFAAQLLQKTAEEERAADQRLTLLAERFVNPETLRRPAGSPA